MSYNRRARCSNYANLVLQRYAALAHVPRDDDVPSWRHMPFWSLSSPPSDSARPCRRSLI